MELQGQHHALERAQQHEARIAPAAARCTRCTQTGGWKAISVNRAEKQTITPTIRTMNTAGPSPESAAARSKPQASQRRLTLQEAVEQRALRRSPGSGRPAPRATGFTGRARLCVNAGSAG